MWQMRSVWLRGVVSILAVILLYWPFASYWPAMCQVAGPSAATGGNPVWVSAPVGVWTHRLADVTWRYAFGLTQAVFSPLVAIAVFTLLTRYAGPARKSQTRCRRCLSILRGLAQPICPACGEPI